MQRYRLIFDGHLQPQASREEVQRQLADLFQVSPGQVEALFSKPPVVLKEDLEYDTALKDKASFEATGALCRLEAQSTASRTTMWGLKEGPPGKRLTRRPPPRRAKDNSICGIPTPSRFSRPRFMPMSRHTGGAWPSPICY